MQGDIFQETQNRSFLFDFVSTFQSDAQNCIFMTIFQTGMPKICKSILGIRK